MFRITLLALGYLMISTSVFMVLLAESRGEKKTSIACLIQVVVFSLYFYYIWLH